MKFQTAGYVLLTVGAVLTGVESAVADTFASEQRKNAAVGHYARARAMLVEALAEFEQGRKYARPDMLIDSEEWRLSIVSRTEELNRILDPKPRVTRDGVRFKAPPILIRREKNRTPVVADGAKDGNMAGEDARREALRQSRASMEAGDESEAVKVIPKDEADAKPSKAEAKQKAEKALSFSDGAGEEDPEAAAKAVTKTETTVTQTGEPAAGDEEEVVVETKTEVTIPTPPTSRLIESEEEEVTTRAPQQEEKKPLIAEEDDEEGTEGAQTVEAKEDEVTREIERAIAERIEREKSGAAPEAGAEETEGE